MIPKLLLVRADPNVFRPREGDRCRIRRLNRKYDNSVISIRRGDELEVHARAQLTNQPGQQILVALRLHILIERGSDDVMGAVFNTEYEERVGLALKGGRVG